MAFVGVAGFNALSGAQKAYLTDFPKNGEVPAAPGALLHPVLFNPALNCTTVFGGSPQQVALNDTVTCNIPTVFDHFNNPTDRNPPLGNLNFNVDGTTKIFTCALAAKTSSSSGCGAATMTWTPTDPALA